MPKQSKAGKTSYEGMIENPGISVYPLLLRPPDQRSLPGQSPQRNPLGKRPETRNNLIARPCDSYLQASIPCPRQADDQVGDVRLLSLGQRGVGDDRLEVRSMRCDEVRRSEARSWTSPKTAMHVPHESRSGHGYGSSRSAPQSGWPRSRPGIEDHAAKASRPGKLPCCTR